MITVVGAVGLVEVVTSGALLIRWCASPVGFCVGFVVSAAVSCFAKPFGTFVLIFLGNL